MLFPPLQDRAFPVRNRSAAACFSVLTRPVHSLSAGNFLGAKLHTCRHTHAFSRSATSATKTSKSTTTRLCHSPSPSSSPSSNPPAATSASAPSAADGNVQYRIQLLTSVADIDADTWDSFATAGCASPFLLHDWIRCLEHSGCATPQKGWASSHIIVRAPGFHSSKEGSSSDVICIIPAYVKGHSMGEFVFDQEWADAAYSAGIMYYPKLLIAIPFTPATGRRILTHVDATAEERKTIVQLAAQILVQVCQRLSVSSVHVNFCADDEIGALHNAGFLHRKGVQYHFTNVRKGQAAINAFEKAMTERQGADGGMHEPLTELKLEVDKGAMERYRDFEDYLSEFKSKKRIKMRRERTVVRDESGLDIEVVRGDQDEIDAELLETMFDLYKSTIDKLLFGRQYLSMEFFQMLNECDRLKRHICLVLARRRSDNRIIGGTFNIVGGGTFYGRYWGCTQEYRYLHFEACYYAAIEHCIDHGLAKMEPGAGGGEFKYMRGFEPCVTHSMHYVRDPRLANAIERYLSVEGLHIDGAVSDMKKRSAIRSKVSSEASGGLEDGSEAEAGTSTRH